MMKVLSQKPIACIQECINCHCILGYNLTDIYENKYIYCPLCKTKQECACDLSYDGVIKDGSVSKEEK